MRLGRIQNNYTSEGFDLVRESGLSFIEICCNNDEEAAHLVAAKDAVLAEIARTGLDVSSVGRWNHHIQKDGEIDRENEKNYFALLDTAIALGAKTFVCGCNYDESVSLYRNYTNAITLFRDLIERADGRIRVAVQNCDWYNFVTSPAQWDVVLGELPDLWIKYDASHAYNRGEDYLAQLNGYGSRVAHVHIKGTTHAGKTPVNDPPAGMDDLAWPSIFAVLYSLDYKGDLSIEPHSRAWNGARGAAGVAFTKKYIEQFLVD